MEFQVETNPVALNNLKDQVSASIPVIYADQIMGIAFGPYVTRLTFGVEDHANSTRNAAATVVMPTNVLHAALSELMRQLTADGTRAQFETQYKEYLQMSANSK